MESQRGSEIQPVLLSSKFVRQALASIFGMISFEAENATSAMHSKKLLIGSSRELNLALIAGVKKI